MIIRGFVNKEDEPVVPITLLLQKGPRRFQAVLDTGFNGYLSVPCVRVSLVGASFFLVWVGIACAVVGPEEGEPASQPRHAPGRLIVKLTPQAAEPVARSLGDRQELRTDELPIDTLRQISQEHEITHWRRLYPKLLERDSTGLNRTYELTCDDSTDIPAAVEAFQAFPHLIEYAEADAMVEIQ